MARILITDDDASMRSTMSVALGQAGHSIVEANGAREALRLLEACPADLIVTDLVMDDMDGIELLRRIQVRWPGTPVIGVSGARHGTIYLKMAKLIGAERVLAKPFSCEEFTLAVNQALTASTPMTLSGSGINEESTEGCHRQKGETVSGSAC